MKGICWSCMALLASMFFAGVASAQDADFGSRGTVGVDAMSINDGQDDGSLSVARPDADEQDGMVVPADDDMQDDDMPAVWLPDDSDQEAYDDMQDDDMPAAVWMQGDDSEADDGMMDVGAAVIMAGADDEEDAYGVSALNEADETDGARLPNPVYRVGTVFLTGNRENSRESILKMLRLSDEMTMDEIEEARVRLAMSSLFSSVEMAIAPGAERGTLDVYIHVVERSHFQVNRYFLGSSAKSPFWMGLDVTWNAPFSTDHRFRMAFGATSTNDYTLSLNYVVPTIADLPISLMFSVQTLQSHEEVFGPSYYRSGFATVPNAENAIEPFDYLGKLEFERHGASFGLGWTPHKDVRLMGKVEYMRLKRDDTEPQISDMLNAFMRPGNGNMLSAEINVSYDTRQGWQLPDSGHFVMFGIKGTAETAASDYSFVRFMLAHQSNFKVAPQHIIRINSFGGAILGDPPMFEKFFFNDFYSLSPSRFQMLNPSSRGAFDLFKTGASGLSYEDYLVHLAFSYAWQPLERRIEVFATVAATWADSRNTQNVAVGIRPEQTRESFPVDLSCNVGVRFKTDYGLFSVTLSNFLDLLVR